MIHELGHGVYDWSSEPWLLRSAAHTLTTEAAANFFGRLGGNPKWLVQVAGVPKAEVDKWSVIVNAWASGTTGIQRLISGEGAFRACSL